MATSNTSICGADSFLRIFFFIGRYVRTEIDRKEEMGARGYVRAPSSDWMN